MNLGGLQSIFYLLKNVYKEKRIYWTGNIRLLWKFSLEIMLSVYIFFSVRIKVYVGKPMSSVRSISYNLSITISMAT